MNSLNLPSVTSNNLQDVARRFRAPVPDMQHTSTHADPRPVRVARFPEEAALFAYNRLAQTEGRPKQAQHVDEYV
jgi:hypothetical protein